MKKLLLSFVLMVAALSCAKGQEKVKGIMCTYEGSETTFAFTDVPTVKYATEEGVQKAQLYVTGAEDPAATFTLADSKQLVITYGEFTPTAIEGVSADKATITERDGKKYIQGGRLIIVGKDGKKHDLTGNVIN